MGNGRSSLDGEGGDMPLTGSFSENVSELISSWKKKGKIGSSRPKSLKDAKKQALAIAYSKAYSKRRGK